MQQARGKPEVADWTDNVGEETLGPIIPHDDQSGSEEPHQYPSAAIQEVSRWGAMFQRAG